MYIRGCLLRKFSYRYKKKNVLFNCCTYFVKIDHRSLIDGILILVYKVQYCVCISFFLTVTRFPILSRKVLTQQIKIGWDCEQKCDEFTSDDAYRNTTIGMMENKIQLFWKITSVWVLLTYDNFVFYRNLKNGI